MGIERHLESSSDKANIPKTEQDFREISWRKCQCSASSQIPTHDDPNHHQFLSLYDLSHNSRNRTRLIIYDTENRTQEVKDLDTELALNNSTSITQLPNGELFCYTTTNSGVTFIIDRNYRIRMLTSGIPCDWSSVLYFENNIFCFGGYNMGCLSLSRKFDLEKNIWINLTPLPEPASTCHSVIFNRNILISAVKCKNLCLYSIEIDSFSIIPYEFKLTRKVLINVERLYLIEWGEDKLIYEAEDEYDWKPISNTGKLREGFGMYSLYNKEKVYFSARSWYYEFDLKTKAIIEI